MSDTDPSGSEIDGSPASISVLLVARVRMSSKHAASASIALNRGSTCWFVLGTTVSEPPMAPSQLSKKSLYRTVWLATGGWM